jgi:hypothetical protein
MLGLFDIRLMSHTNLGRLLLKRRMKNLDTDKYHRVHK